MAEPLRRGETPREDFSRRAFLKVGAAGAAMPALGLGRAARQAGRSVILLNLVGGPSPFETWDPKPEAPAEIRGPFGSIATAVPGVRINEFLPGIARRMDRVTLVRSVHHDAAPIHETGLQLLQTGRLSRFGDDAPHFGSVVAYLLGDREGMPASLILPDRIGNTGVGISRGQSAGSLGLEFEPVVADPNVPGASSKLVRALDLSSERAGARAACGRTPFGENCLRARRLVEAGARVVTVNMFTTVFHQLSWDCHGSAPFSTLADYRRELLPTLDMAFSGLIDDLERTGLLDSTMVLAAGEFGRSPRLNASGGRDHWPDVWSVAFAGGGMPGGGVIGSSDAEGGAPRDRPVTPAELLATLYRFLGIDIAQPLLLPGGERLALAPGASPIVG